jgi:hypothetical protein
VDVLTLLREARDAGLRVHVDGENLVVEGPTAAAPIVEKLRQHKPEVLAVLRGPCCRTCEPRTGPPLDISDGCTLHGVTPETVAHWWKIAEEMGKVVSVCHCCGNPATNEALVCRKCEGA